MAVYRCEGIPVYGISSFVIKIQILCPCCMRVLPLYTGGLLWSPLACAVLLIALSPSREAEEQSRREEVEMAVDKVRQSSVYAELCECVVFRGGP